MVVPDQLTDATLEAAGDVSIHAMAELLEHQHEALAVARHRNVMLCSTQPVGKTFLAAMRIREWLQARDAAAAIAVAIAPTPALRATLLREISRLCSALVWSSDAQDASASDAAQVEAFALALMAADPPVRIALVSPRFFQAALRKGSLRGDAIGLLVLEAANEIHDTAPSLFRQLFEPSDNSSSNSGDTTSLHIFATAHAAVSALVWDPRSNPLYRHIHMLSMVPLIDARTQAVLKQQQPPLLPPLLTEPFQPGASTSRTTTAGSDPTASLPCPVRDFLLGNNEKKWDFVRILRAELEMGNSAAVYDEKKKQERVNRFIADAEGVYEHLGLWCLLKFVELELQGSLHACLVQDAGNINQREAAGKITPVEDAALTGEDGEVVDEEVEEGTDGGGGGSQGLQDMVDAAASKLDDAKLVKIRSILKILEWLATAAKERGIRAATPRLRHVALVLRHRISPSSPSAPPRCWVFVERRAHCSVVAEYLSVTLADLGSPPCCSMLGASNARVAGALHLSSYLKVVTMLESLETHVVVTTSIATASQRMRVAPPRCDLVVVMDELLEPDKLRDYCSRADPRHGAVKYVLPDSAADLKRFRVLERKLQELVQLEAPYASPIRSSSPAPLPHFLPSRPPPVVVPSPTASTSAVKASSPIVASSSSSPGGRAPPLAPPPAPLYAVVHRDTGATLDLSNSVAVLSKFCDTLPGLDTYDRRPQYLVTRHPLAAAAVKKKKKRLSYNSSLDDKIEELVEKGEGIEGTEEERFLYSAKLRLPVLIGAKKEIAGPKVASDTEAKAIVAFKGCQELLKRGLLDRRFESMLEPEERPLVPSSSSSPSSAKTDQLADLSAQNSYDLPPASAAELGLSPVRSLLDQLPLPQDNDTLPEVVVGTATVSMHLYALHSHGGGGGGGDPLRLAILSSSALYTGATNTGWRYDFATSDVLSGAVHKVALDTRAVVVPLSRLQLEELLRVHLILLRLACMRVADAARAIDIATGGVWKEFAPRNDKGYLVVPVLPSSSPAAIDWGYVRELASQPLVVESCWPLPSSPPPAVEDWVCVPRHRGNVCYAIRQTTAAGEELSALAADNAAWQAHLKAKPPLGVPVLGRWHRREDVASVDAAQLLLHGVQVPEIVPLIRRVMQRHHASGEEEGEGEEETKALPERYLLPQASSRLRLSQRDFFQARSIVPLLYEFERKCQMSTLMAQIGVEIDLALLDAATTKPLYERLEILGDCFLKLETSWFLFDQRKEMNQEGALTQLRRDIIRNDRLTLFARGRGLHKYMWHPAAVEQHPFKHWKPSCMGDEGDAVVAPAKWIADVLEAVCGAYLVDKGEQGGRHFLQWVGVSVPSPALRSTYYPDCFPNELYASHALADKAQRIGFRVGTGRGGGGGGADVVGERLIQLQLRLKYAFNDKRLLLEALTHPSVGPLVLSTAEGSSQTWRGDYERLEYLGDAVIEYLTLSYAFTTYSDWLPGSLSQWKSATVCNDALGKTAIQCFGVDECLLAGALKMDRDALATIQRIERKYAVAEGSSSSSSSSPASSTSAPSRALPKIFADVFEALVAAVFLDSGHDLRTVRDVFLGPLLEVVGKDAVLYVCRESGLPLPEEEGGGDDGERWVLGGEEEDDDDDEDVMRAFR